MTNFLVCRRLVTLFVYCGVAALVIVNGQSATDDDIDKDEIDRLNDTVAELRAELASTKDQLVTAVNRIAKLEGKTRSRTKVSYSSDCVIIIAKLYIIRPI